MINRLKNMFWHPALAAIGAVLAGFPARRMTVIGVTGTKGKSTTCDMLYRIFSEAGYHTALASTIRFAYPGHTEDNRFKMTMPGRGFIQRFLARAAGAGATHAIIELTSEGARQSRHRFLFLNALIVTNIEKEHIESHGSFEKYVAAKRSIVAELEVSPKKNRALVLNADNAHTRTFLDARVDTATHFSEDELSCVELGDASVSFIYSGVQFSIPLKGVFNALNALAAIKVAEHMGIPLQTVRDALSTLPQVRGRVEPISLGQPFSVVVDYAHTVGSLAALYGAFETQRKICVLGNTGGGRDRWKRPEMGACADQSCALVILTNEDPYDENPRAIVDEMAAGMTRTPRIILDRREAIRQALREARPGDVVLITGKGSDPFIMGPHGEKNPWSDAEVVREELHALGW